MKQPPTSLMLINEHVHCDSIEQFGIREIHLLRRGTVALPLFCAFVECVDGSLVVLEHLWAFLLVCRGDQVTVHVKW